MKLITWLSRIVRAATAHFPIANGYEALRAVAKEAAIGTAIGTVAVGGITYAVDVVFIGE